MFIYVWRSFHYKQLQKQEQIVDRSSNYMKYALNSNKRMEGIYDILNFVERIKKKLLLRKWIKEELLLLISKTHYLDI